MYLIFEVLRLVLEQPVLYRPLINPPLYGHLVPIKEKQLRESFQNDWLITALPLVYQRVSDHISEHMVICEWIIVLV